MLHDAFSHRFHNAGIGGNQIITAHSWFPGNTSGNHYNVTVFCILVIVGTMQFGTVVIYWGLLPAIEGLTPSQVAYDVEKYNFVDNVFMG